MLIIKYLLTCAIRSHLMWDNLCTLREIIYSRKDTEFFILSLDQRKAFDYISHFYLWEVMKAYNMPETFISMIKVLYKKSLVQIKVNGRLTEPFRVECGVKQGCPLSAALCSSNKSVT